MPLRSPDHLTQAFEQRVQRRVLVAARGPDPVELGTNARRLIDRELLGDGEVQRQVQERIGLAALRLPVAIEMSLGRLDDRVVFRMERDQLRRRLLERRERLARAKLRPGADQETPRFIARRIEHRSRITHSGQRGSRARHT